MVILLQIGRQSVIFAYIESGHTYHNMYHIYMYVCIIIRLINLRVVTGNRWTISEANSAWYGPVADSHRCDQFLPQHTAHQHCATALQTISRTTISHAQYLSRSNLHTISSLQYLTHKIVRATSPAISTLQ